MRPGTDGAASRLRRIAATVSPRARRWRHFLATLDLDPERLPTPVPPPSPRDFIICGSPRTGTTLLAAMLFQPPRALTVHEPWDGLRLPPADLFASLRDELSGGSLSRGKLHVDALVQTGTVEWATEGTVATLSSLDPTYSLGVKWPTYWRYLGRLRTTRFLVCLRHPFEVIGSYRKAGGRLAQGLDYDVPFNAAMNAHLRAATRDPAVRQVLFHDYVTSRIVPHVADPNVLAVRYERWFADAEGLLDEIGRFLEVEVASPLARLRPVPPTHGLARKDLQRIRELCTTADALGYPLEVSA